MTTTTATHVDIITQTAAADGVRKTDGCGTETKIMMMEKKEEEEEKAGIWGWWDKGGGQMIYMNTAIKCSKSITIWKQKKLNVNEYNANKIHGCLYVPHARDGLFNQTTLVTAKTQTLE